MPRQSVIAITIRAVVPYDRTKFGDTGDAEARAKAFMSAVQDRAEEDNIKVTESVAKHTSVEK